MLTDAQQAALEATGHTRISGVLDSAGAADIEDIVWAELASRGIVRTDRSTWPVGVVSKNQGLRDRKVFGAFDTDETTTIIDQLLGARSWDTSDGWDQALLTFPMPGPWVLPHRAWHVDLPGCGDPHQPHVARLFAYATDVVPFGGATLVVEGSHELVRRLVATSPSFDMGGSADLRKTLARRHRWFNALRTEGRDHLAQFMTDGDQIDGVRVRVAELTADAGDVVVMLPWTLHNGSMNCVERPRFMATRYAYRTDYSRASSSG